MLVRREVNQTDTVRGNRQDWPQYAILRQEFRLDPWESDDVLAAVSAAFSQSVPGGAVDGWHSCPMHSPLLPRGEHLERVLEDPETGFIYYRSPTDIERSQQWNQNRAFRVNAANW